MSGVHNSLCTAQRVVPDAVQSKLHFNQGVHKMDLTQSNSRDTSGRKSLDHMQPLPQMKSNPDTAVQGDSCAADEGVSRTASATDEFNELLELVAVGCSHPLFDYVKQTRRVDGLLYSDEDRNWLMQKGAVVTGCGLGSPSTPNPGVKSPIAALNDPGEGSSAGATAEDKETPSQPPSPVVTPKKVDLLATGQGLLAGVLDAFAGLLSFYSGSRSSVEKKDSEAPGRQRSRYALACQFALEERKIRIFISSDEEDDVIGEDVLEFVKYIWQQLRELSKTKLTDLMVTEANTSFYDAGIFRSSICSDPTPLEVPALANIISQTFSKCYPAWHTRFAKHYPHIRNLRRITDRLMDVFGHIEDGDGAEVCRLWQRWMTEAAGLEAKIGTFGRQYVESFGFRKRMFSMVSLLSQMVEGQGTVADILLEEDKKRWDAMKEQRERELQKQDEKKKKRDAAGTAEHVESVRTIKRKSSKLSSRLSRGFSRKAKAPRNENGQSDRKSVDSNSTTDASESSPPANPLDMVAPSLCRAPILQCMRKLIAPFEHIETLIQFAAMSKKKGLLENDLEIVPVYAAHRRSSTGSKSGNSSTDSADNTISRASTIHERHHHWRMPHPHLGFGHNHHNDHKEANDDQNAPPSKEKMQDIFMDALGCAQGADCEPPSTYSKAHDYSTEITAHASIPSRRVHPEIKLLNYIATNHIPVARHIGVSSSPCIPCITVFGCWNNIYSQRFQVSGPVGKKTKYKNREYGNGRYYADWTLPEEWKGTSVVSMLKKSIRVRLGEAVLREVNVWRIREGFEAWWTEEEAEAELREERRQKERKARASVDAGSQNADATKTQQQAGKLKSAKRSAKAYFNDPMAGCNMQ